MSSSLIGSIKEQERHEFVLKTFVLQNDRSNSHKQDIDIIKKNHQFLWDEESADSNCWETRLARRYYEKLFREYCIADLTRYKDNKIALRWRTKNEVVIGKGHFQCGSLRCEQRECLRSWEVNFAYLENGIQKNALVKLRLCPHHSKQLNFTSLKRESRRQKMCNYQPKIKIPAKNENQPKTVVRNNEVPDREADIIKQSSHPSNEDLIWKEAPKHEQKHSREADFERYLEELIL